MYEVSYNNYIIGHNISCMRFCQMVTCTCVQERNKSIVEICPVTTVALGSRKQFVAFFNEQDFLIYRQLSGCVTWDRACVRVSGKIELPFKSYDSCMAEIVW